MDPPLDGAQSPAEAVTLDLAPQLGGVAAALVPAPVQVLGMTVNGTAARAVTPTGEPARAQPAPNRCSVGAQGAGDAPHRPALAMQRQGLTEPGTAEGMPIRGLRLCGRRCRRGQRRLRYVGVSHGSDSHAQVTVMPVEHPGQGVTEIAKEVEAGGHLDGLGSAAAYSIRVSAGAVTRDDLDARGA